MKSFVVFLIILLCAPLTLPARGQQEDPAAEGLVPIEILAGLQWQSDPMDSEEFAVWNGFVREDLGINLSIIMPPHASYNEKLNVLFASGDLPDIVWDDRLQDRVQSGYVRPIDDFLQMPKYKTVLDEVIPDELWDYAVFGGETYFLPNPMAEGARRGDMIRADWLDNLGLDMPETVEDIKEVFHQFRHNDPNQSGRKDTYAASFRKDLSWFDGFHGSFGLQSYWWPAYNMPVEDVDGTLVLQYTQQKYKDYLAFMRDLWANDVFDPNSFLNAGTQWAEMRNTGQVGYWHHYAYRTKTHFQSDIRDLSENPDAVVEWVPGIKGPYGQGSTKDRASNRFLMITTESKNPEKAMDYLTWVLDPPEYAKEFLKWGIEGKQYIVRDGERYRNPHTWDYADNRYAALGEPEWFDYTQDEPGIHRIRSFKFYANVEFSPEWLSARYGEYGAMVLRENDKTTIPLNTLMLGKPILDGEENIAEMRKIVLEHTTRIIVGQMDLDAGFDRMIRQLRNVGLDRMMAARQEWYDANKK